MTQVYELVTFPVEDGFKQVIQEARGNLFIAAPYIKNYGVQIVLDNARTNNLRILTNLDLANRRY